MLIHLIRRTATPCGGSSACGHESAAVGTAAALLVAEGLVGNVICLLALRRLQRRPRDAAPAAAAAPASAAHALLSALAAANLLAVASCAPLAARLLGLYQPNRWRWATWAQAHVEPCVAQLALSAAALLAGALACQRCAAVCWPLFWRHSLCSPRSPYSPASATTVALCCFAAAALLASPLAVLSTTCQIQLDGVQNGTSAGGVVYGIGDSEWAGEWAWPAYWWAWHAVCRVVPGLLVAALPALVVRRLRQLASRRRRLRAASDKFRSRQQPPQPQPQPQGEATGAQLRADASYRGERRQVALLVALAALWALTLLPAEALSLALRPGSGAGHDCEPLAVVSAGLELCSAALPCVAFLLCSGQFRGAALAALCPLLPPDSRPASVAHDSTADYGDADRGPDAVHMEFVTCNGDNPRRNSETVGILRCQSPA